MLIGLTYENTPSAKRCSGLKIRPILIVALIAIFCVSEVLPRLKSRWPDIAARLQRSAGHAGEASQLLVDLAEIDLRALGSRSVRLPIDAMSKLSAARQRNLIRYALRDLGLSTPTAMQLDRIQNELIPAREDAQPLVTWPWRIRSTLSKWPLSAARRSRGGDQIHPCIAALNGAWNGSRIPAV